MPVPRRVPRAATIGSSVSGIMRMPSCFSTQRTRLAARIPYLSLSLLGMTICPFDVTLDDEASISLTSLIGSYTPPRSDSGKFSDNINNSRRFVRSGQPFFLTCQVNSQKVEIGGLGSGLHRAESMEHRARGVRRKAEEAGRLRLARG
jgi:hypothetical protein